MQTDVLSYLDTKNIKYQLVGEEAIITCPTCGKDKLSINIKSLFYQCFVCKAEDSTNMFAKGHFSTIMKYYGDMLDIAPITTLPKKSNQEETDYSLLVQRYHFQLNENKNAKRYLAKRGFTQETIDRFNLGFTTRKDDDWIVIPSYENGIPKLLKLRKLTENNPENKKYTREFGSKSILFNGDAIDKYDSIIIVEGEFDAIALIQAGFENVVGITGGAGTLLSEWYDQLLLVKEIILCFDSDKAGQKASREVWAKRLGVGRVKNLLLPKDEDINSYLLKYTVEQFKELLKQASYFKVDGILSMREVCYEMYRKSQDNGEEEHFELPWENVNKLLGGGLRRSRLTTLGGIAGVGKTSFALQILYNFAIKYNKPSLFFCMEMPETSLGTKIIQLAKDMTRDEIRFGDALLYELELGDIPIYFGYSSKVTPDTFYNTMVEVNARYGVELGVFDNLHRMIRDGEESSMAKASGMFKDITMDLDIPFILVSQPRKLNSENNPTFDDLKGSSAIPQDSDEVILLHRIRSVGTENMSSLSPEVQVLVDKSRFASGGRTRLKLIGEKSRFEEIN